MRHVFLSRRRTIRGVATRLSRVALAALLPMALAVVFVTSPTSASADDPAGDRFVEWHRRRALALQAEGRVAEAAEEFTAIVALRGHDAAADARAAVQAVEAGSTPPNVFQREDPMYRLAEGLVTKGVRDGGLHDPSLAYAIGRLRLTDQKWDKAYEMLDFARRRGFDPVRADFWWFRAGVNYGPWLIERSRNEEAVAVLQRLVKEVPDHPDRRAALINLATAHRRHDEHTVAESIIRNEILTRWPSTAKAWDVLGQVYADQARIEEALECHRRAMDIAQEVNDGIYSGPAVFAEALKHTASLELKAGRIERAEALANQYLRLQPEDAEGEVLRGQVFRAKFEAGNDREDLLEAVRCFRRAARMDAENEVARGILISLLPNLGPEFTAERDRMEVELRALQKSSSGGHATVPAEK